MRTIVKLGGKRHLVLMDEAGPGDSNFCTTMWRMGARLKVFFLFFFVWPCIGMRRRRLAWKARSVSFCGLGLGDYRLLRISVRAGGGAEPSVEYMFFRGRFRRMARITLTTKAAKEVPNFYFTLIMPRVVASVAIRSALFSRAIPHGIAESWLEQCNGNRMATKSSKIKEELLNGV